jgi:hypothetical protein
MSFLRSHTRLVIMVAVLLGIGTVVVGAAFYRQQPADELNISVCDPAHGPFSLTIDNPFLPFPVGMVQVLEDSSHTVQMSVLNQTEIVAGISTRVVEEREWENGRLAEVARNFFVQAPDGTVCYYGEDVDEYWDGKIVAHGGAWRAGVGQNKPGIIMPAHPSVGQTYQQELAPAVANDRAEHVAMEGSYTTPAGTFHDVLLVNEKPSSTKRYARGIGLIFDAGAQLTKYSQKSSFQFTGSKQTHLI